MRIPSLAVALLVLAAPAAAAAQQFTIGTDLNCSAGSYVGSDINCGYVSDGGYDAFDGYGVISNMASGLTLSRRVDALTSHNVYRFVDTFSNLTDASITGQVVFSGNLGSDGYGRVVASGNSFHVSADAQAGEVGGDPVLAFVYGNNAFALGNMTLNANQGWHDLYTTLTLAPGQSVSVMSLMFLARDINRGSSAMQTADEMLAVTTAQALVANPLYDGLSADERARIVNFDEGSAALVTPEPGTWALLGSGLLGIAGIARRRRKA